MQVCVCLACKSWSSCVACVQIEFEIPPELQIGDSDSDATQRASILGLTCCMRQVGRGCLASRPSSVVGWGGVGGRLVSRLHRVVIQVRYKNRTLIYRCHRLLPLHGHIIFIFHGGVLPPPSPPPSSSSPTPSSSSSRVHSSSLKTFTTSSSFKRK